MVLDGLYLAANVAVLVLLLRWKYYREFPMFVWFQAFACMEIASRLLVLDGHRGDWAAVHLWLPCAILLMAGTVLAAGELLWKAMHNMPRQYKIAVVGGVAVVLYSFPPVLRLKLHLPEYSTWFENFTRADLTVFYLCVMMLVVVTFGIICTVRLIRQQCPRYVRFHGLLLAVLFACYVYLTDFAGWHASRQTWMAVKLGMCLGFLANAHLLRFQARLWALSGWGGHDLRGAVSDAQATLFAHLRGALHGSRLRRVDPGHQVGDSRIAAHHRAVDALIHR